MAGPNIGDSDWLVGWLAGNAALLLQSPGFKLDAEGKPDASATEPLAEEAKFFTESRLLNRDVNVYLEAVNNNNFVGSVVHPVNKTRPTFGLLPRNRSSKRSLYWKLKKTR